MNAGEEWTERRRRGTTTAPQQAQPPHSVDSDACSTLRGLERLSAIFADHWEAFQHAHPRYQTPYYHGLVGKMLACGSPAQIGYMEYRCLHCGQGKHVVAMSCKSSLCLRCAKVAVDNWVSQVSRVLHEGVIYRHIIR